jgi:hypothetical protein
LRAERDSGQQQSNGADHRLCRQFHGYTPSGSAAIELVLGNRANLPDTGRPSTGNDSPRALLGKLLALLLFVHCQSCQTDADLVVLIRDESSHQLES